MKLRLLSENRRDLIGALPECKFTVSVSNAPHGEEGYEVSWGELPSLRNKIALPPKTGDVDPFASVSDEYGNDGYVMVDARLPHDHDAFAGYEHRMGFGPMRTVVSFDMIGLGNGVDIYHGDLSHETERVLAAMIIEKMRGY